MVGVDLHGLWERVRALECCGAGYYAKSGFLHLDVGQPRFWEETTSRVGEDLSADNARVFARTDFDRYGAGEPVDVRVYSITLPPLRVSLRARLVSDAGRDSQGGSASAEVALRAQSPAAVSGDCIDVAGQETVLREARAPARAQ